MKETSSAWSTRRVGIFATIVMRLWLLCCYVDTRRVGMFVRVVMFVIAMWLWLLCCYVGTRRWGV